ncbi:(3S,6E)-nerolidol synthase 1 isoform X2 [Typha latifolia]|uniref:(3S,6E)-nerolidol synthase 1 isoform X2 n=1 Tax=Typha latifolia TaxID=4733 RepID=UPI003C3004C4
MSSNYPSLRRPTTATPLAINLKTTATMNLNEASGVRSLATLLLHTDEQEQDLTYSKYMEYSTKVRRTLTHANSQEEALMTIDSLKRLGIDYIFRQEITSIINSFYVRHGETYMGPSGDLFQVTLAFRLLREAGYDVSSDIFDRFTDSRGDFNPSLSQDIRGILSLHDASYLNKGEDVLYKANEFAAKHLKSSISNLEPNLAALVTHTLDHPYHMSLQQYKSCYHLSYRQGCFGRNSSAMEELAAMDFNLNQLLHQKELEQIASWWRNSRLAEELPLARDQLQKWYFFSTILLPDPQFSEYRIQLAKAIAFIYLIDDIYDVMGSLDELSLFTEAIDKWEHPDSISLPHYMKACYKALYDVTNQIADTISQERGWNPINSMKKSWAKLCNAFMVEARWFTAKQVPMTSTYLKNAVISTGLHIVLVHIFFLIGQGITKETVEVIESDPGLITCPATILRLWDDLGSAKDENQEGFDGSYIDCYMKENPQCSVDDAREHVMDLISKTWEALNKECFSSRLFSPDFIQASLNSARMARVAYSYDDQQRLPMLEEYVKLLLSGKK